MDKNEKFLRLLPLYLQAKVLSAEKMIFAGKWSELDVKKLRGGFGYRVRVGNIRILFRKTENNDPDIFFIGFRNSVTYRKFR